MSAPDISAEAVERLASDINEETNNGGMLRWCPPALANEAAATLRALRAALDAAERERDEARREIAVIRQVEPWKKSCSYARGEADGIRKAAGVVQCGCRNKTPFNPDGECACPENCSEEDVAAILALLPATDATKETSDE